MLAVQVQAAKQRQRADAVATGGLGKLLQPTSLFGLLGKTGEKESAAQKEAEESRMHGFLLKQTHQHDKWQQRWCLIPV